MFHLKSNVMCSSLSWILTMSLVCVQGAAFDHNLKNSQKDISDTNLPNLTEHIMWIREIKQLKKYMKHCVQTTNNTTWSCLKTSSARIFDDILSSSVIPLGAGVRLVRMQTPANEKLLKEMTDYNYKKNVEHLTWFDGIAMRLAHMLTTHFLQVNLQQLTDAYMSTWEKNENRNTTVGNEFGTARHRRQRYNMLITMMFGVTALGAVLVPMGFQMLSIVSGKALLLAKMALLLASINGLKKVANSGIHYGLYQVPGEHYGYYDRGDAPYHPRQVPTFAMAQSVPAELVLNK